MRRHEYRFAPRYPRIQFLQCHVGPVFSTPAGIPKFNHFEFVAACAAFPRAPLSIGWTTGPPQSSSLPLVAAAASADIAPQPEVGYEDAHVDEMIALCQQGWIMRASQHCSIFSKVPC